MEFEKFRSIARLSRDIVITEKIDGTNAQICITEEGDFLVGSRTRWITPENDNHGFARWANENKEELLNLGVGRHYGEWWGQGIQRKYGMSEKRFSLFDTHRWAEAGQPLREYPSMNPKEPPKIQSYAPQCCHVVPVLYEGDFNTGKILEVLEGLKLRGSVASPGFMNPEGVVIYHKQGNVLFKKTFENDEKGKSYGS